MKQTVLPLNGVVSAGSPRFSFSAFQLFSFLINRLPARFELLDGVAQFGGPLVKLLRDCAFHLALHDLEFAERPFRTHLLEPFFEKRDLTAFRRKLREIRLLEKLYDGVASSLNFAH